MFRLIGRHILIAVHAQSTVEGFQQTLANAHALEKVHQTQASYEDLEGSPGSMSGSSKVLVDLCQGI